MTKKLALSMSFVLLSGTTLLACSVPSLTPTPSPEAINQATNETTGNQTAEDLAQAVMTGDEMQCAINNLDKGESIKFLTKDKKMKVATNVNGDEQNSYMISDTQFLYIWTEGQTTGVKTRVPTEAEIKDLQDTAGESQQQSITDFSQEDVQEQYRNQGYTIDCRPGEVNDAEFIPPSNITFQDMSALMDGAMKAVQRSNEAN